MNILDYAKFIDDFKINYDAIDNEEYDDIKRMIKVCNDKYVRITPSLANKLWSNYSEDLCACWLCLPDSDEELFRILVNYAKKYNKEKRGDYE